MEYREILPRQELAERVECFWFLTGSALEANQEAQRVLPDGCPELIFNFGDPFQRCLENGGMERQGRALVSGQLEGAIRVRPSGTIRLLGLRFRPGGAHGFLGFPLEGLTNCVVELEAAVGRRARPLVDEILNSRNRTQARDVLEKTLMEVRSGPPEAERRVEAAVIAILAARGVVSLSRLADGMGISGRQLSRQFRRVVGLGPKQFCRIIRFQQVFKLVKRGRPVSWAEVAAECGYYDQSHLINDFKEFSGETPPGLFAQEAPLTHHFTRRERMSEISKPAR
ncbi:MAG: AraC family transcriptional regulator [Candidatus Acidiferrales bacterium]